MRISVRNLVVLGLGVALVATACSDDSDSSATSTTRGEGAVTGSITVDIASSLNDAFEQIVSDFEAANPGAQVTLNPDSSSALATQIQESGGVDVFASADEVNMDKVAALLAGEPVIIARNQLEIATKPGNPENIATLADLADAGIIALCGEEVPCGKYAAEVLDNASVSIPESSITRGENATATLGQVSQGDAVAGIVYVTDVKGAGDEVEGVEIPENQNAIAVYPMAVLEESGERDTAQAFVDYVASPAGQQTLKSFGFLAP
jgi:molybdate transport system substrate-binding protein